MELLNALGLLTLAFVIYFLPWLIAVFRRHRQAAAITVLNTFLGWTLIG